MYYVCTCWKSRRAVCIDTLIYRFYADPKQRPKYNLLFVLSGGGKFNYFGTKHLIFEQMDNQDDDGLLPQAEYTMCLDEIAAGDSLFVHVSKPPKEGTKPHKLLKTLNEVCYYTLRVWYMSVYTLFLPPILNEWCQDLW